MKMLQVVGYLLLVFESRIDTDIKDFTDFLVVSTGGESTAHDKYFRIIGRVLNPPLQ